MMSLLLLASTCCPPSCCCRRLSPALLIKALLDCFTISTVAASDSLGSLALANGANRNYKVQRNGVDADELGQPPRPQQNVSTDVAHVEVASLVK